MTAPAETGKHACPACGAPGTGRFCRECGVAFTASFCASCRADLIDGARFCHRCGLPAGVEAPATEVRPGTAMSIPWIVAAVALLALIALIAGQRLGANRPS
ncbi:MAG TPA: zinc ribbon domain-containing protein [Gemmatimonadaceae bacterium]|nr:zinc ribbon domain-containing protein [Gemmatimonadaceae bacterium]